jgi:hypothetical protein
MNSLIPQGMAEVNANSKDLSAEIISGIELVWFMRALACGSEATANASKPLL